MDFLDFTIHMSIGAVFVMIQTYFQLRLKFRTIGDLRANNSMINSIHEDTVNNSTISEEIYGKTLEELREKVCK